MVRMTKVHDEPTLDELLGDPMTQALMHADRVNPIELANMLASVAREIAGRSGGSATALVAGESDRLLRPMGMYRDAASRCVSGSRARSQPCGAP
jgi:hypothetical protein